MIGRVLDPFQRPFGAPAVLAADAAPRRPRRTADGRPIGAAIRPSAGIQANYDARLRRLLDEMCVSVLYWVKAAYRREDERIGVLAADSWIDSSPDPSSFALDARPSTALREVIRRLRRRWLGRFDEASQDLARYFATAVWRRNADELRKILRRGGLSVEFRPGRAARDALAAIVEENVALIRSIPQQYLTQVEGSVMRSVVAGRDLAALTSDLQHQHGVTRRRAELISLHQNNMATGAIQRVQYLDLGIERAIWRHSHAGKCKRPSHVANDGEEYDVRTGWYDPHERRYIRPGELIHCFPGSTQIELRRSISIERLWRSFFNGPVINLVVGTDLLQSTPNHPILTRDGWKSANAIEVGDEIICVLSEDASVVANQEYKFVTSFADLFETCLIIFGNVRRSRASFDFYGDVPDSDVDEVAVDHGLLLEYYSLTFEQCGEFRLAESDGWVKYSVLDVLDRVLHSSAACGLGILSSLFDGTIRSHKSVCVSHRSARDGPLFEDALNVASTDAELASNVRRSISTQVHCDDLRLRFGRDGVELGGRSTPRTSGSMSYRDLEAAATQRSTYLVGGKADGFGSFLESRARSYQIRCISEKFIGDFSGHVYTMQTNLGYYTVGAVNVLAKNCRCFSQPILPR